MSEALLFLSPIRMIRSFPLKQENRNGVDACQTLQRNMKAYFANSKNKDNLNSFVFNELERLAQQVLTESQTLVLTGSFSDHERAVSVSSGKKEDLLDLFSNQQEADTRIMLQISDCIKCFGISTAIVWSPDADVFIPSAHFSCKLQVWD